MWFTSQRTNNAEIISVPWSQQVQMFSSEKMFPMESSTWWRPSWNKSSAHWGRDKMAAKSQTTFSNAFLNENIWISIKISMKFVPKSPMDKIPALVKIMACRRTGDKSLSEPMMTYIVDAYICVPWPQWVKWSKTWIQKRSYCGSSSIHYRSSKEWQIKERKWK